MMNYWNDKDFWSQATWRAFRTFCQSLAGMLVVVQTSNAIPSTATISIPWQVYLYSSVIAALVSLLQSVDRERAVGAVLPEPAKLPPAAEARLSAAEAQLVAFGPGCGGDQR